MKNILMKDKRGLKAGWIVFSVLFMAVAVCVTLVLLLGGKPEVQDINQTPGGTGSGGAVDCSDNEPYITNDTSNALAQSSKVSVTYMYATDTNGDGEPSPGENFITLTPGSTGSKFAVNQKLIIFSSASNYIDKYDTFTITKCGQNLFSNLIYATDTGSLDLLDDNTKVSDVSTAVGTLNISKSVTAGAPVDFTVRLTGKDDESTGQLLITVEHNDTETSDMTISESSANANVLNGDYSIDKLAFFVAEGTAPTLKKAFLVDEIIGAKTVDYLVNMEAESGLSIGGVAVGDPVFVNVYSGQWFVDTDNTLKFGFANSDKTLKYEDVWSDHDAWIQ